MTLKHLGLRAVSHKSFARDSKPSRKGANADAGTHRNTRLSAGWVSSAKPELQTLCLNFPEAASHG